MPLESEVHAHVPAEKAELFTANDACSTELEYLEFLYALVRVTKPLEVLETGTYAGFGTRNIVAALHENARGHLWTIDEHDRGVTTEHNDRVTFVQGNSLGCIRAMTDRRFDLLFFDSDLPMRVAEFVECKWAGIASPGATIVFHDTSRLRTLTDGTPDPDAATFWRNFENVRHMFSDALELPLSRGMVVARLAVRSP